MQLLDLCCESDRGYLETPHPDGIIVHLSETSEEGGERLKSVLFTYLVLSDLSVDLFVAIRRLLTTCREHPVLVTVEFDSTVVLDRYACCSRQAQVFTKCLSPFKRRMTCTGDIVEPAQTVHASVPRGVGIGQSTLEPTHRASTEA